MISWLLIAILIMAVALTGCGKDDTKKEEPNNVGQSNGKQGDDATTLVVENKDPLKIGVLAGQTGLLEAYAQQTIAGFYLGLEYATNGTNEVAGRKIEVLIEDDQLAPDVAIQKATKLLSEDKVDILVGTTSSAAALAVLDVAEEYKKIMIVEPAVADDITGSAWNKYIFRTGRNSSQDAAAAAASIEKANAKVAIYAQDYAFGQGGAAAFTREAEKLGHEIILTELTDPAITDHTAHIQKVMNSGADYVYVVWAGANTPWLQMQDFKLFDKVTPLTGFPDILGLTAMGDTAIGLKGFTVYNYSLPKNKVNDWLVEKHTEKYNGAVPDLFTAGGFTAAMAIVEAINKTGGDSSADTLIAAMEGMSFDSPKGKMTFRAEDHQALQTLYAAELVKVDSVDYPMPKLIREIAPEETVPPIMNKR